MASCVTLTTGLLIMLLVGPWRLSFVSPGKLSAAHAAIAETNAPAEGCTACHSGGPGLGDWVRTALASGAVPGDSTRCLACHFSDSEDARARALLAHNVDPRWLAMATERAAQAKKDAWARFDLATLFGGPPRSRQGEVACATCHGEHHGREHELTAMQSRQCQACHTMKFQSLGNGHPEFRPPSGPRGGIDFDHVSHSQSHFGDAEFSCVRCHAADLEGRAMPLLPFSRSCGGCHYQGRPDHHRDRIRAGQQAVLQLPYMEFFEPPADWSDDIAMGEELTPMMRLLLAGDDTGLGTLQALAEEEVDWIPSYWQPQPEDPKAILASAIKGVFRDFIAADDQALSHRIARALDAAPDDPLVGALVEQLSAARFVVLAYQRRWLPELVGARPGQPYGDPGWSPPVGTSGWYIDPDTIAVSYGPVAHADPFLRAWIDALAAHADGAQGDGQADEARAWRSEFRAQMLEELASKDYGGLFYRTCLRCHTVEQRSGSHRVHWQPAGRDPSPEGYSKFDHGPHVLLLKGAQSCQACHQLTEASGEREGAAESRSFLAHSKDQCATCHAPGRADESCLTCHDYHFPSSRAAAR